ncbi:MAG: sigma-54-dependent Fis family transcriptional regulator [Deltaproteobacteria bacterium]|nr:sigma-54-dependent Fis family transcriptional regulator [Deltaproteobacteria bacterium]
MRRPVILIVDDEEMVRKTLEILLKDYYEIVTAKNAYEAIEAVRAGSIDMVLMDVNLPGVDGIKALERIKGIDGEVGVVMLSASDSAQQAVKALRKGAYDYVTKPFDNDDLLSTIKRLADRLDLKSRLEYLKGELQEKSGYGEIISKSPKMKKVFDLIQKVGRTSSSVLITGESGTGKELVARAIQSMGERKDKPFVAVNCGAIPSELMESELFGHEKGSFTGAHAKKIGKFEYADGGTVFLDEVSTLPMHLQIKLLRVLQEKSFERVGSNVPIKVDIRVIAAANVDLEKEVRKGGFREDLYYRLKVVPIELPPLRDRVEDIPLLVEHFLDKHSRKCNKAVKGMTAEAIEALMSYKWPGNIRELENLIERLIVLSKEGGLITYDDLPLGIFSSDPAGQTKEAKDFKEACKLFERHYIIGVLNNTNWNRLEAARRMNIHRNTLMMKMKDLKIRGPRRKGRVFNS